MNAESKSEAPEHTALLESTEGTPRGHKVKRPSFQFYPADWRKHPGLRLCSVAARGLWIDLMCIAHECDDYGKLAQNGIAFCHKTIAKLVGLAPQTCRKLLEELENNRVFLRDENGVIYSPRMIREEHVRNVRAASGSKGGNPFLLNQKPTPSFTSPSSSSSATSATGNILSLKRENKTPPAPEVPECLRTPEFEQAWDGYIAYRKTARMKPLQPASIAAQLKKLSEWGHDTAIAAITETIANGWQGIFKPTPNTSSNTNHAQHRYDKRSREIDGHRQITIPDICSEPSEYDSAF